MQAKLPPLGGLERLSTMDGYCHRTDNDGGHIAKVMMYKMGQKKKMTVTEVSFFLIDCKQQGR